jgi:uncharacterized protein (TIGR02145 family)
MKKMIFYIFIFAAILNSCQKDTEKVVNINTYTGQSEYEGTLISKFIDSKKISSTHVAISILLEELKKQNKITNIGIGSDSSAIFWTYEDGIRTCLYIPNSDNTMNGGSDNPLFEIKENKITNSKGMPRNLNALILSPVSWQLKSLINNYDETESIANKLETIGFAVKYKSNNSKLTQTITFDDFKNLGRYGLIYLKTHGSLDPLYMQVCLSSGIIYTEASSLNYNDELKKDSTLMKFIDPEGNTTFGLTPKWFKISFPQPPIGTLFFASACSGNQNSTLSKVIIGNGSAFYGWDYSVTFHKAYDSGIDIFNGLIDKKLNCYDSWLQAFQNGNCIDKDNGKTITLYLKGDTSLRLIARKPTVTTSNVLNITSSSANVGGTILYNGGSPISEQGNYYGTSQNPETSGIKLQNGTGSGIFSTSLIGLASNTIYYVKAYAINSQGISFGAQISFSTLGNLPVAAFTSSSTNINIGQSVQFTDQSTNTPTSWSWNFGDGGTSTLMNPTHTYSIAGTYSVSMTATNSFGSNSTTKANYITVNPITIPVYQNSSIGSLAPNALYLDYSMNLALIVPSSSSFTVTVNSLIRAINSVSVTGNRVILTLVSPVLYGDIVTVSYTKPTSNPLQSATGSQVASFSNQSVTNNVNPPSNGIIFNPNLTYGSLSDIDGNIYKTIQIGTQIWMAENLKTTRYNDGSSIPLLTSTWYYSQDQAYCWYDNNETAYKDIYGALYSSYAIVTNKLCPTGWHSSTDSDWLTMITYLGGESVAGAKLKEVGSTHWTGPNSVATNETGFTALPSGYRRDDLFFNNYAYWSSPGQYFYARYMLNNGTSISINRILLTIGHGYSVRCVKD